MDVSFSNTAAESFDGDVLLLVAFEGADDASYKAVDAALGGAVSALADARKFTGKKGQSLEVHAGREGIGAATVIVLGAGPKKGFAGPGIRDLVAVGARAAQGVRAKSVGFAVPAALSRKLELAAQMAAEGALEGTYRFKRYLTNEKKNGDDKELASFAVLAAGKVNRRAINEAVKRGEATAEAVCKARDFINEPAGYMTPEQLADEARAIARGLSAYSAADARLIIGHKSREIGRILGYSGREELIHRDDMGAVCMRGQNTSQAVSVEFFFGT